MSGLRQQFTFIDVTAQKRINKTKVKSHAAGDANRRKRQDAVRRYQEEISRQTRQIDHVSVQTRSTPGTATSSSPDSQFSDQGDANPDAQAFSNRLGQAQTSEIIDIDTQVRQRSQWRELYQNSWVVFQTSLAKRQLVIGEHRGQTRSVKSLPNSSSDGSIMCTGSVFVPDTVQHSRHNSIQRINTPARFERVRLDLAQIHAFLRGKHDATWIHNIRIDPFHYQHDYEVGLWRECFFLAFDQLALGKSSTALAIMDTAFGATSQVVRKQHPSLLYALLEVMHEARSIRDSKLNSMVQRYLAQLTGTLLGPTHPVALLMRSIIHYTDRAQEWSESLFQAVIHLLAELFGINHFQTLGTQFGAIRGHMNDRRFDAAQNILNQIQDVWRVVFPPGSIPLHVLDIEKAKVAAASGKSDKDIDRVLNSAIRSFEELAVLSAGSALDHQHASQNTSDGASPGSTASLPAGLSTLGRTLAAGSYHALTLYMYTHVDEIFRPTPTSSPSPSESPDVPFAARVVQIMRRDMDASLLTWSTWTS